ncbi:MAG: thiol peroxidase [Syntrophobacteraceae bacterium]
MPERPNAVTMRGNPLTLVGDEIKVGDKAPDFQVTDTSLSQVKLSSYTGKIVVIVSVPSLDTPVCDLETRKFNQEAAQLSDQAIVLVISMDLPFAQKRWSGAAGVSHVITLSDHREASFGLAYGLLIKELRLLGRAVIVVDRRGIIRYLELVKEIADEPNYEAALKAVNQCLTG